VPTDGSLPQAWYRASEGVVEWPQQVGVFLELSELASPIANAFGVLAIPLALHDASHIHQVLGARGDQLVDDEILSAARVD
jgi:uncharacterized membrane protein YccF (DUF307 family)